MGPVLDARLPLVFVIPNGWSWDAGSDSGIGNGDLVASAVLLVAAAAVARRTSCPAILYKTPTRTRHLLQKVLHIGRRTSR